jgi:hypothetical protein
LFDLHSQRDNFIDALPFECFDLGGVLGSNARQFMCMPSALLRLSATAITCQPVLEKLIVLGLELRIGSQQLHKLISAQRVSRAAAVDRLTEGAEVGEVASAVWFMDRSPSA